MQAKQKDRRLARGTPSHGLSLMGPVSEISILIAIPSTHPFYSIENMAVKNYSWLMFPKPWERVLELVPLPTERFDGPRF